MIEGRPRGRADRTVESRAEPKRQDRFRSQIPTQTVSGLRPRGIDALDAPAIDALAAPAKLERKIWQEVPTPELYFWTPLHCRALVLDEVLIKRVFSLEKCIAPVSEHTKIGFAEATAPDIGFYIAGQIESIDQFAREQCI